MIQVSQLGNFPYISLGLAISFAFYGLVRKKVHIESMSGLFIETLLLLPFSVGYLGYLISINSSAFVGDDSYVTLMLMFAGIITVLPLLWFNIAVVRIRFSTMGFLQYIGPSVCF